MRYWKGTWTEHPSEGHDDTERKQLQTSCQWFGKTTTNIDVRYIDYTWTSSPSLHGQSSRSNVGSGWRLVSDDNSNRKLVPSNECSEIWTSGFRPNGHHGDRVGSVYVWNSSLRCFQVDSISSSPSGYRITISGTVEVDDTKGSLHDRRAKWHLRQPGLRMY